MFRYQLATGDNPKAWAIDAQIGYLVMGPALRVFAGFTHTDIGNSTEANMVQFGAQAIFF
jgi:hypothetical protein